MQTVKNEGVVALTKGFGSTMCRMGRCEEERGL